MALRKFSKHMKVMTIVIILSLILSTAYIGYTYLSAYLGNRKEVLLLIDGNKIYKKDYDNQLQKLQTNLNNLYGEYGKTNNEAFKKVPEEVIEEMALASMINNELFKIVASNLKLEVSSVDVKEKLSKIEEENGGKEKLALLLSQRGLTINDLKDNIKDSLLYEKLLEKYQAKLKPTDQELERIYKRFKYSEFESREFDVVKEDVEKLYYQQNLDYILNSVFEEAFYASKIKAKNEKYYKIFDNLKKDEVTVDKIKISRKDMLNAYVLAALQNETGYSENIEKTVNEQKIVELKGLMAKAQKANSMGIKGLENVNELGRIQSSIQNYYYYLVDNYNPSEEEMKAWFVKNKAIYDTKNTVSGEIFGINYKASEEDKEATLTRAKELMKTITKENFKEKAKALSKDFGSAQNGGSIGFVNLNRLVPEFSIVSRHKVGEIVGPVQTQYGVHIIYIEDKKGEEYKLSHILLQAEVSNKTKEKYKQEVLDIAKDIKEGKLTFEKIFSDTTNKYSKFNIKEQFSKLEKNSALPKVGYYEDLMDELFKSKTLDFISKDLGDAFVVIQKTQEIPFKEAKFEDFKERIKIELGFVNANREMIK